MMRYGMARCIDRFKLTFFFIYILLPYTHTSVISTVILNKNQSVKSTAKSWQSRYKLKDSSATRISTSAMKCYAINAPIQRVDDLETYRLKQSTRGKGVKRILN